MNDKQVCEVHTEVTKTVMHNGLWKERLLEHHKEQEGRRAKVTIHEERVKPDISRPNI